MLTDMAALGFEYVELSHGIRITLVPGIMRAVEEGVVKVSSTHNFCPLPTGVVQAAPNLFEPSVKQHREHDQWLRHTKRTIDFAAQVKARVVKWPWDLVEFNAGELLRETDVRCKMSEVEQEGRRGRGRDGRRERSDVRGQMCERKMANARAPRTSQ